VAQKKTAVHVDDINGNPAAVVNKKFGLDGVSYEMDLDQHNVDHLNDLLGQYAAVARRVGGRKAKPAQVSGTKPNPGPAAAPEDTPGNLTAEIRAWAQKHNMKVAERGRLSKEVVKAYLEATNPKKKCRR
jgi:hypothetical protein